MQMMVLAVGASFFAGVASSFFGIGGGIVFVPLMVGMGMTINRSVSTSQLILLIASLSGVITHGLLGHADFIQAGFLVVGSFAGGLAGARLSVEIKARYLRILVSVVILVAAGKLFIDSVTQGDLAF